MSNLKLVRNLNTERNKEQEDSFNETLNYSLYFDINKKITKVDSWKISSIKKLVSKINNNNKIIFEFSKWNSSVEYLYKNLNLNLIENLIIDSEIKNFLKNKNILEIENYLLTIKNDNNKKLSLLFLMLEEIGNKLDIFNIVNKIINEGISKIDLAIEILIPIWILGDKNG